jgi:hypothetical protein
VVWVGRYHCVMRRNSKGLREKAVVGGADVRSRRPALPGTGATTVARLSRAPALLCYPTILLLH